MLVALLTVAVLVLALALTTTVVAAPMSFQPAPTIVVPAEADGGTSKEAGATSELQVRRGCWLVCWR